MGNTRKLLLVEDCDDDVFLFRRALKDHPDFELVWRAKDGQEAIEYFSGVGEFENRDQHPLPDIVVTDLQMPRVDNFQLLSSLAGTQPRPRLIVLSSSSLEADQIRAKRSSADFYAA